METETEDIIDPNERSIHKARFMVVNMLKAFRDLNLPLPAYGEDFTSKKYVKILEEQFTEDFSWDNFGKSWTIELIESSDDPMPMESAMQLYRPSNVKIIPIGEKNEIIR